MGAILLITATPLFSIPCRVVVENGWKMWKFEKNEVENFFTFPKGVKSIRNHARNPKKLVLKLYDQYFLRKLDFFKGNWTCSKKNAQKNRQNEKNHKVFSNSAELQNRPNTKYTIYILYNALYSAVYILYIVCSIRPIRPMMRPYELLDGMIAFTFYEINSFAFFSFYIFFLFSIFIFSFMHLFH